MELLVLKSGCAEVISIVTAICPEAMHLQAHALSQGSDKLTLKTLIVKLHVHHVPEPVLVTPDIFSMLVKIRKLFPKKIPAPKFAFSTWVKHAENSTGLAMLHVSGWDPSSYP